MRILEMVVLGFGLLLLIVCTAGNGKYRKIRWAVSAAAGIASVLHLLVEGYRWQLYPVYIVTLVLIITTLFRQDGVKKTRRIIRYPLLGFAGLLLALSVFLAAAMPVFKLPKPDGEEAVGTVSYQWTDQERLESYTPEPKDVRKLMVQMWYPAKTVNGTPMTVFPEEPALFREYMNVFAESMHLPGFALDYWKYARSNSFEEAPVQAAERPYPLIIINHGMGTSGLLQTSQAEHLASHGYIVVAIDHTYSTAATAFPDGTVTNFRSETSSDDFFGSAGAIGELWTQDVAFVIRQLEAMNSGQVQSPFAGCMDMNNIGTMGHSFGGATAFEAVYSIESIKAGINMDGTLFTVDNRSQINKPFMFLQSDNAVQIKEAYDKDTLPDNVREHLLKEMDIINRVVERGGFHLRIKGSAHYNFTDLQLYSPLIKYTGMTGDIEGHRGADIVNRYVLDFFNHYLKGTGGELLSGPRKDYPEVEFQQTTMNKGVF
ncbi:carboxylic ester hydrolase [Paenibacillus albidus]|uniref:Carboxylic ester hydrolase n=1 Tax=Paenibacillus albidus TaxID=2041023 RepID=A0A917C2U8_9BACL|nr:hypothetical protein [Paenibacillus albidus]GGF69073.1 carboxylic ester hydrolase [Paenibacillus albidus]